MRQLSCHDYTVGWISSIPIELAAAKTVLDREHEQLPLLKYAQSVYSLGEIHKHNVVIVCLPLGTQGHIPAASVARDMQSTFPRIEFWLLVGIGGGVPTEKNDIQLGDVIVSKPSGEYGGVIQYDFGRTMQHGIFERTGVLNKPSEILRSAVSALTARHILKQSRIPRILDEVQKENPSFEFPGRSNDQLFETTYVHPPHAQTCQSCDRDSIRHRKIRDTDYPKIHYGLIATGNELMRDAVRRDQLAKELDILCFEMEAAGLMDRHSCLVIRGISDYADSHKNDDWQPYAALTAAAYAKDLLHEILPAQSNVPAIRDISPDRLPKKISPEASSERLHEEALRQGFDNYRTSVVDLLKVLGLDYDMSARDRYADILQIHVGPRGSARQNTALRVAIMERYSKSGNKALQILKPS